MKIRALTPKEVEDSELTALDRMTAYINGLLTAGWRHIEISNGTLHDNYLPLSSEEAFEVLGAFREHWVIETMHKDQFRYILQFTPKA